MKRKTRISVLSLVAVAIALAFGACDEKSEEHFDTAAEQVDKGMEDVGDHAEREVEQETREMEESAENAAQEVDEAADEAAHRTQVGAQAIEEGAEKTERYYEKRTE